MSPSGPLIHVAVIVRGKAAPILSHPTPVKGTASSPFFFTV